MSNSVIPETMRCFLVRKAGKDQIDSAVEQRPTFELPPGEVLVRVDKSSLNYKDALAATGHPGVARRFPHVPGIDAAGAVVRSESPDFSTGDAVIVTSYELGVERWGGWAEDVRVPADWVLPLPEGLSFETAITLGTAGLAAGLSVRALEQHGLAPAPGAGADSGATVCCCCRAA